MFSEILGAESPSPRLWGGSKKPGTFRIKQSARAKNIFNFIVKGLKHFTISLITETTHKRVGLNDLLVFESTKISPSNINICISNIYKIWNSNEMQ